MTWGRGSVSDLPLVSVITPSLNQRRFIEATIESVLSQDYPRIEYIVMDGGSTDGTLNVLRRYEGRIQWTSEPDRGQSHAINKGFRRARGDILAWLNSDDTYLPGAVRTAVDHLMLHPTCAMVYGEGYLIDEAGGVIRRFPATEPFNLWKLVYGIDYILQQTVFLRREALEAVDYLDEGLRWGMDWDLFIKIGKRFRVDHIPKDMANLREHRNAKTMSGGRTRLAELLGVMRRHGSRRYPPALFAYGIDTYFRLVFEALGRVTPVRLASSLLRVQRLLEKPVYGSVGRVFRHAQGLYPDGWLSGTAHFLLPRVPGGHALVMRGTLPVLSRVKRPVRLRAVANGRPLGVQGVEAAGDFEVAWDLPPSLHDAETLEVRLECEPTFRPSAIPFVGDRRRLACQLKAVSIE